MIRLLYILLVGLVGAVLVHLAVVVLVPKVASQTAWSHVSQTRTSGSFEEIADDEVISLGIDPGTRVGICRYDLADGIVRMFASGDVALWTVSVISAQGEILFSANDRNVSGGALDLAVVTPAALREIRQQLPESLSESVIVNAKRRQQGYILLRAFQPDETWEPPTNDFFATASCFYDQVLN